MRLSETTKATATRRARDADIVGTHRLNSDFDARLPPRTAPVYTEHSLSARSVLSGAGLVADRVHDAGVGKRGDVTKIALLRDITQQPPHDLSGARLGQVG